MNACEEKIRQALEAEGWNVLSNGWPDFLCWRDEPSGRKVMCVEVKNEETGDSLRKSQILNHAILAGIGLPTQVIGNTNLSNLVSKPANRAEIAEALLARFERQFLARKADFSFKPLKSPAERKAAYRARSTNPDTRLKLAEAMLRRFPKSRKAQATLERLKSPLKELTR